MTIPFQGLLHLQALFLLHVLLHDRVCFVLHHKLTKDCMDGLVIFMIESWRDLKCMKMEMIK